MKPRDKIDVSVTPPLWRRDDVRTQFENDHLAGRRPRIEAYLRFTADSDRDAILEELVELDVEFRQRSGEAPSELEYRQRFPSHEQLIDAAFREARHLSSQSAAILVPIACTSADCDYVEKIPRANLLPGMRCPHCDSLLRIVTPHASNDCPTPIHFHASPHLGGTPQRIGRFEVRDKIGSGGFGIVYRAYDPRLEREVAVKLSRASSSTPATDIRHFLREAKAAARLNHPNIVPVHDADSIADQYYIAYAYVESITLAEAIKARPFDPQEAARIILYIARALATAHDVGIVHRDIKPHNILLGNDGIPLITDFGLAHLRASDETLTEEGAIIGTPAYMAPEQAAGERATASSDQYGLGVVLYELLTQRKPFLGSGHVVISQILSDEPVPPRQLNRSIPQELEAICLKAMNKLEADRYPGCADFADDLERFLAGDPVHARPNRWIDQLKRWCARPQRIRDAGVVAILTGIFFVIHSFIGVVHVVMGTPATIRPLEALFYLALIASIHASIGYLGMLILQGSRVALWTCAVSALVGCLFTAANIGWGFFDVGGLLSNPQEIRVLYITLFFIAAANLVVALLGLYASRRIPFHSLTNIVKDRDT